MALASDRHRLRHQRLGPVRASRHMLLPTVPALPEPPRHLACTATCLPSLSREAPSVPQQSLCATHTSATCGCAPPSLCPTNHPHPQNTPSLCPQTYLEEAPSLSHPYAFDREGIIGVTVTQPGQDRNQRVRASPTSERSQHSDPCGHLCVSCYLCRCAGRGEGGRRGMREHIICPSLVDDRS
jgi:hypothetical protein